MRARESAAIAGLSRRYDRASAAGDGATASALGDELWQLMLKASGSEPLSESLAALERRLALHRSENGTAESRLERVRDLASRIEPAPAALRPAAWPVAAAGLSH